MLRPLAGRHPDTVTGLEIADRLDTIVDGVEVDRRVRDRHHALDGVSPDRLVPQIDEDGDPGHRDIDAAGDDRVVDRGAAAELGEDQRDIAEPGRGGMLLDELSLDGDVDGQIGEAGGLGEADFVRVGAYVSNRCQMRIGGQGNAYDNRADTMHPMWSSIAYMRLARCGAVSSTSSRSSP